MTYDNIKIFLKKILHKIFSTNTVKRIFILNLIFYSLDSIRKARFFSHRFYHPHIRFLLKNDVVSRAHQIPEETLKKLVLSLKSEIRTIPTSQWKETYHKFQSDIIPLIENEEYDKLGKELLNPLQNNLLFGLDNLANVLQTNTRLETRNESKITADSFLSLAESLGIRNIENPESLITPFKKRIDINEIIEQIINKLFDRKNFLFPNPLNGEKGLKTNYGVVSIRVPVSIYQSVRLLELGKNICEIGPGIGRTAYFAAMLGATKYTLVDIPIVSLVQSHFLIQSLNNKKFIFNGQKTQEKGIHFMTPNSFFKNNDKYDVVFNSDSLTEIGIIAAREYLKNISKKTRFFLSINNEGNEFSIRELTKEFKNFHLIYRNRPWIRKGYVEELYEIRN